MKLMTLATSLAVASLAAALPLRGDGIFKRQLTCPVDVVTCSAEANGVDACCLPDNGQLLLVQQWLPGYGPPTEFTMHGLWPNTCSNGIIGFCDDSRKYTDIEARLNSYPGGSSLVKDLHTFWPSYKNDNNAFWAHEWSKHGTCLSNLAPKCTSGAPKDNDVYTYFDQTLKMRSKYNLYQALAENGILPGSTPQTAKIQEAMQAKFGVQAEVNCKGGVLNEIWLYFNVKNGIRDWVPVTPVDTGSCRGAISYPKKTTGGGPKPTTSVVPTPSVKPTTTTPPGSIPTGIQKGKCDTNNATVCVQPGVSHQYSKCVNGTWILNQCKTGLVCHSDSATATRCAAK
ncbi:ribonuclease T2-like [Actinomortierella ambigua]|uniref:ribonuclease T2 n=1 Tax=Actinomortierella ambigua TaxID=1343610 RepID=A0A9P6PQY6_9FUNG|nr:ribonuclease T2-like [Actinomortierella ambigua]